jgi:uncharacterized repeat protein (TIGR02543 family)
MITITGNASVKATFSNENVLTVNVVGYGYVDLDPSGGSYSDGTSVSLTAVADLGWMFTGWSVDLTGSNNPETITMDDHKTVTATFTHQEYTLTVNVEGNGIVNLNASAPFVYGDVVELAAAADSGWNFSGWSEDLSGSTNPEIIFIYGNKIINATFTLIPVERLFEDSFESGDLAAWDGVDGGASVSTADPYQGTYHLTGGLAYGANNGWSGVYKRISGTNPLYLGAYVYFNAPPTTNGEDQWVLCLSQNPSGDAVAYAGIHRSGGTLYWTIWYRSGTSLTYYVSSSIYSDGWHRLELAVHRGTSNDGRIEFYVDGVRTCSVYDIDNDYRTLNYARVGFSYSDAPSSASSTVYIDDVTIDI